MDHYPLFSVQPALVILCAMISLSFSGVAIGFIHLITPLETW